MRSVMTKTSLVALLLLALGTLGAAGTAQARKPVDPDAAAAAARNATGGRVLGVKPDGRGGNSEYRVKVLEKDGRVRTLRVDKETGRVKK